MESKERKNSATAHVLSHLLRTSGSAGRQVRQAVSAAHGIEVRARAVTWGIAGRVVAPLPIGVQSTSQRNLRTGEEHLNDGDEEKKTEDEGGVEHEACH